MGRPPSFNKQAFFHAILVAFSNKSYGSYELPTKSNETKRLLINHLVENGIVRESFRFTVEGDKHFVMLVSDPTFEVQTPEGTVLTNVVKPVLQAAEEGEYLRSKTPVTTRERLQELFLQTIEKGKSGLIAKLTFEPTPTEGWEFFQDSSLNWVFLRS